MNTAETVKKASSNLVKFSAGGLGFGVGLAGMSAINKLSASLPSFVPEFVKKLVPGVAVMFLSYWLSTKAKDDRLESALLGVGFSGGADAIRRLVGGFIPQIKAMIPAAQGLEGTQGSAAINVGDFQVPYYKENAFQGFSMQGMSMQGSPYALNGGSNAYALNGSAYALNGRKRKGLRGLPAYALN